MRHGRIHTLLTDVERLLLVYRLPIIEGALHVYYSALAAMLSCLLLEETVLHDGYGIPFLVTKRTPGWGVPKTILEAQGILTCIVYSPNSKLIASVGWDGPVRVWNVLTGTVLHAISVSAIEAANKPSDFTSVAFSPDSQWIVCGGKDCTVQLWDVVTGSQHRVMKGHTGAVLCVAFSPDGTIIVSGSCDHTLRSWNAGTGDERQVMTGHTDQVNSLALAPNGQTIVSASNDGTLRVWDILTGTELRVAGSDCDNDALHCVAFSPDGATIALGSRDGTLQLFSATTSTQKHALEVHDGRPVLSLAFSPDSKSIVSCDRSRSARIWDVTTGIEKLSFTETVTQVGTVAYSPDGKSIAIGCRTGSKTGTIRIWDANTEVAAPHIAEGHQAHINSVAFSFDGLLVASGSDDGTMRIWDAGTGTERHVVEVENTVVSIAFSPDNRTVVCGHSNGTVQVWDAASGQKKPAMMGKHAHAVYSVAFSSDGKSIASYSFGEGTARVWDAETGAQQHVLTHPDDIGGDGPKIIAFSVDSKLIITRESRVVGFWDLTTIQFKYTDLTSPHKRTPAINAAHASEQYDFELGERHPGWICHRAGQKEPKYICWLPQKLRGWLASSGTKVCVGGGTGILTILDFSPVDILQPVMGGPRVRPHRPKAGPFWTPRPDGSV
jgi:WD40 repeat protein